MLKLMEEFGELCAGVAKNNQELIKDSIGDCFVVLVILNKQMRLLSNIENEVMENFDQWGGSVDSTLLYFSKNIAEIRFNTDIKEYQSIEWFCELSRESINGFKDAISNLTYIADRLNLDFKECVQHAYNEIKDRKGVMRDGVFIKEEDL